MKEELSTMHAKLEALTKTTRRINLRIVLDKARDLLLSKCGLEYDSFKDSDQSDALVSMVQSHLSKEPDFIKLLTVEKLALIFKPSTICRQGNTAVHIAEREALAEAVLSSALTTVERQNMIDIYTYVYGESPELTNC
ncbi:hypothetical protein H0H92_011592 [Tricholoma furcatifolium]|nr:hypothetical protein H0H92_011592 [Tricholoma furcatifolium]